MQLPLWKTLKNSEEQRKNNFALSSQNFVGKYDVNISKLSSLDFSKQILF